MNRFLLQALNRAHLLKKINTSFKREGFIIPVIGGIGHANLSDEEKWMTALIRQFTGQFPGTFIDVGVNVGQTLLKVRKVSPAPYIGFEPNPACVFYCEALIRANGFKNTTVVPAAIAKDVSLNKLKVFYDTADAAGSLIDEKGEKVIEEKVIVTINESIISVDKIGILKIDVEGSELFVAESLKNLIARDQPVIFVEMLPAARKGAPANRKVRQDKLVRLLKEMNYLPYLVVKSKDGSLYNLKKLDQVPYYDSLEFADFVFASEKAPM